MVNSAHVLVPSSPALEEPYAEAPPPATGPERIRSAVVDIDPRLCGNAVTLLHRVLPGRQAELVQLLEQMGKDIDGTRELRFNDLQTVHFLRWVVVEGATPGEPAQLMFESNHDGTLEQHLSELLQLGARAMHQIYRCCEGYPAAALPQLEDGQHGSVSAFLQAGQLPYQASYVGRRGRSARRIQLEGQLRDAIQRFLDGFGADPLPRLGGTPRAVYDAILAHLHAEHAEPLQRLRQLVAAGPRPPERSPTLEQLKGLLDQLGRLPRPVLVLLGLPLVPLAWPLLAPYLWLRRLEQSDVPLQLDVSPEQTWQLAQREDFQVQNQLTHLVAVKPGIFRQLLLRLVLGSIDLLGKLYFNQGDLGGLATIHYARWVLIDGGRRLIFFSNYDGSWERYLGDFVDQAHVGLTAVWSNTQGFPRTKNLVQDGATDEEHFKNWTRQHQIPTQLWYSAYPQLTVPNVGRNGQICAGLLREPDGPEQLARWLELL